MRWSDYLADRWPYGSVGYVAIALGALRNGEFLLAIVAAIAFSWLLCGILSLIWLVRSRYERCQIRRQLARLGATRREPLQLQ